MPLCLGGRNKKMKAKSRQSGLTLTEMTVVIAVVALLVSLGLPAVRMLFDSFESQGGGRAVISAALASARAIAAKEQRYAGVRFQKIYHPNGPLRAPQYMIFIVYEEPSKMGNLTIGFRAVEGVEPIKLPDGVGLMDLRYRANLLPAEDGIIDADGEINNPNLVRDTTTFSIVFSPSGKMVIHDVRVRNRDGEVDGKGNVAGISNDDIFNKKVRVDAGLAMFYQDDYFAAWWSPYPDLDLGLGPEPSRNSFIIYEEEKFRQAYENGRAWSDYLRKLVPEYINPYTGTMIER